MLEIVTQEKLNLQRPGSALSGTSQQSSRSHSTRIIPNHSDSFFNSPRSNLNSPALNANSPLASSSNVSLASDELQYIPPWSEPYIIGVAGCSGSGKTSVASKIIKEINQPWTVLLSLDNFYRPLTKEQRQLAFDNNYDFDTPDSLDLDLMYKCVKSLKEGKKTEIPVYSFTEHNRTDKTITIYGANVIIIEGIYGLFSDELSKLMDTKIYVDTDLDICLARRLNRDIIERSRDLDGVIKQWNTFVKPNSVKYVIPTLKVADLVIPRGSDNHIGINLIIRHLLNQLEKKSRLHLKHLAKLGKTLKPLDQSRIIKLPSGRQLKAINTILLNKNTKRDEFIFYFDRLATMLLNVALDCLNYEEYSLTTPQGHELKGLRASEEIIGINIIRSGDCFMNSIKRTIPDVSIGKLLIQSDSMTGEPQLHTESLPPKIYEQNCKIFIFDAQILSGAAAIMAIQVLLDHGIELKNIILVSYLVSEIGARRILNAFGEVKIVVGLMGKIKREDNASSEEEDGDLETQVVHNDQAWWFRTRFVDNVYFGTN